jgi:hypothetical protein
LAKDGGDKLSFPVAHFELLLPAELVNQDLGQVMDSLVKQCYLYGNAHLASRMKLTEADGSFSTGAHYSSISTLVTNEAQWMTFSGPDGLYTNKPVPMAKVRDILAKFITSTGKFLYFPVIAWEKNPELLEALTDKSVEEILQSLDRQLGKMLTRMPVHVFILTAQADGEVDQKESQQFLEHVKTAASNEQDQSVFANSCRQLMQDMRGILAEVKGIDHAAEFQIGLRMIDLRVSKETRAAYKQRLYELAESVANASGGGFFGIGSKISDAERQALGWIRKQLFPVETT